MRDERWVGKRRKKGQIKDGEGLKKILEGILGKGGRSVTLRLNDLEDEEEEEEEEEKGEGGGERAGKKNRG
ncbi:hypothetical protein E2C01_011374 [Portunus trituberculatus]|uniref:Uncharacterized protein n=1 Tax=Portunus trituberculatus TaxID=210409 RepID=A0A5B7DAV4_PORTR|nr:hypothetical protein [Portunus trituberculatus]